MFGENDPVIGVSPRAPVEQTGFGSDDPVVATPDIRSSLIGESLLWDDRQKNAFLDTQRSRRYVKGRLGSTRWPSVRATASEISMDVASPIMRFLGQKELAHSMTRLGDEYAKELNRIYNEREKAGGPIPAWVANSVQFLEAFSSPTVHC